MAGKTRIVLAGVIVFAGCSRETARGPAGIPEPEARAVATVSLTEGPTVDAGGIVYFSELRGTRIMKYTPGSGLSTFRRSQRG